MTSLRISAAVWKRLAAHVTASYPTEAVGLLVGRRRDRPSDVRPLPNEATYRPRISFRVGPEALARARADIDAAGLRVVGVYHSHIERPARPSDPDRKGASVDLPQLIVSARRGDDGEVAITEAVAWIRRRTSGAHDLELRVAP